MFIPFGAYSAGNLKKNKKIRKKVLKKFVRPKKGRTFVAFLKHKLLFYY